MEPDFTSSLDSKYFELSLGFLAYEKVERLSGLQKAAELVGEPV